MFCERNAIREEAKRVHEEMIRLMTPISTVAETSRTDEKDGRARSHAQNIDTHTRLDSTDYI